MSESFFIVQILHSINQFSCPAMNTFKQLYVFPVVMTQYVAAIFKVWSYEALVQ